MRVVEGQTFERVFLDQIPCQVFEDMEFRRCSFRSCLLSRSDKADLRSRARNVRFVDCTYLETGGIDALIAEDVCIENLKTVGLLQTWGIAFKHVTLRGKIGRIMLSDIVDPRARTPLDLRTVQGFRQANEVHYAYTDWALDISKAEFVECDIRGVPARLIRRDPETQAIVTRDKALDGTWRALDLSRTYWSVVIDCMLQFEWNDVVLVAPKRSRQFKELLEGLKLLRKAGVAEPD